MSFNFDFDREETKNKFEERAAKMRKKIIGLSAIGIAVLFGLITLINAFTVISPGYSGVQYSLNGGLKQQVLGQGMKWHAPWVNVYEYPTSTEMQYLQGEHAVQVNTGDGKSVTMEITWAYSMVPEKLPHIFTKFRRQNADQISNGYMKQEMLNVIQNITTKHSVLEVYSQKRDTITADVRKNLGERLGLDGITLEQFTISDVIPDAKTVEKLQQIADEEARGEKLVREKNNLVLQNQNIDQQKINEKLAAERDKEIAEIKARQKAEVRTIEAEAEAAANRKIAESVSPQLVEYIRANNWNGVYPTHMLGSEASVIVGK